MEVDHMKGPYVWENELRDKFCSAIGPKLPYVWYTILILCHRWQYKNIRADIITTSFMKMSELYISEHFKFRLSMDIFLMI
jgi:hypothetical protein